MALLYSLYELALRESEDWSCWLNNLGTEFSVRNPVPYLFMLFYDKGGMQDRSTDKSVSIESNYESGHLFTNSPLNEGSRL
jgi:hypothetical protein